MTDIGRRPDHHPRAGRAALVADDELSLAFDDQLSQGTDGAELPATLLSRYDRQALKSGFPVIQRLLEFTADLTWLTAL